MPDGSQNEGISTEGNSTDPPVSKKKITAVVILILVNLLNYIDRFTIVGVMSRLKEYFLLNNKDSGLLQTVFICSYMIFAPLFGYLGDRYNRKHLMMIGISIWVVTVFLSSFCGKDHFLLFLFCRGMIGIGEASYSTIAPTIISDLFKGAQRSKFFMFYFFAVPIGSGLGFILGSRIALLADSWQWGVRFSPIIGVICLILMYFLLDEPVRGEGDGRSQTGDHGSYIDTIRYLLSVKTYIFVTLAMLASFFTVGAMSWWTSPFIGYAYAQLHHMVKVPDHELAHINLIFGVITCLAGLFGVATGSSVARAWKDGKLCFQNRASEKADTFICSFAMAFALPFLFCTLLLAETTINWAFVLLYVGTMSMCLVWSLNVDIYMYVIIPNRRASAIALQNLITHLFGDASSPYIVGIVSDALRGDNETPSAYFNALQKTLFIPIMMLIIASIFYFVSSFYIVEDRKKAVEIMGAQESHGSDNPNDESSHLMSEETPQNDENLKLA